MTPEEALEQLQHIRAELEKVATRKVGDKASEILLPLDAMLVAQECEDGELFARHVMTFPAFVRHGDIGRELLQDVTATLHAQVDEMVTARVRQCYSAPLSAIFDKKGH